VTITALLKNHHSLDGFTSTLKDAKPNTVYLEAPNYSILENTSICPQWPKVQHTKTEMIMFSVLK
jgi:hypothetical protein